MTSKQTVTLEHFSQRKVQFAEPTRAAELRPFVNQIALEASQSNGFQTAPYLAFVTVSNFDPRQIAGITSSGEQVD